MLIRTADAVVGVSSNIGDDGGENPAFNVLQGRLRVLDQENARLTSNLCAHVKGESVMRTINEANFPFNDPGWRKVSEEALDLVQQLLMRDPLDRPCLEEVLQHPFCADSLQEAMEKEEALGVRLRDEKAQDAALAALEADDDDDDLPR